MQSLEYMSAEELDKIRIPLTIDNINGTSQIKQHIFKRRYEDQFWYSSRSEGNISLCGKIRAWSDDETPVSIKKMLKDKEEINSLCCKKCLEIYERNL